MSELTENTAKRIYLETFGCQMNVLDSQLVRGSLHALGYQFVEDWKDADVVLYNTCSVREHAEQKVYSRVGEVGVYKNEVRPDLILGVIGCMAEREGEGIAVKYPQIDLICGPGELDKVPMLIDNVVKTSPKFRGFRGGKRNLKHALQGNTHRRSSTLSAAGDDLEILDLSRSFSPDEFTGSAYVRITRGCNKFCTYCVVPNTRGREIHRAPDNIIEECKRLVDAGVVEITLLGQTVNHYHYNHGAAVTIDGVQQPQIGAVVKNNGNASDTHGLQSTGIGDNTTSFADLLYRIHEELPSLLRLRFVTNFPRDFGDDILQVIRDCPRICRFLHLPVQSGSDRILSKMNRGHGIAEYYDLIDRVREILPDAELATDVICGFPTETDEDHRATAELLERCRFKNAFIFKYSPRPGTAAMDRFEDDVPDTVKKQRNNELLAIQFRISAEVHAAYLGRTVRIYVESISSKARKAANAADPSIKLGWQRDDEIIQLSGRTDGDLIVMFEGQPELIGSIVDVKIDRAAALTLFGERVAAPVCAGLTNDRCP